MTGWNLTCHSPGRETRVEPCPLGGQGDGLRPERLAEVLATVPDRRQERAERRCEPIAELNKRAAEIDLRLKRLYDAIGSGVADLDDPVLKDRIAGLKATRDQARADAERARAMLESPAQQAITPAMVRKFASTARADVDRGRRISPRTHPRTGPARGGSRCPPRPSLGTRAQVHAIAPATPGR
jgi:hypothetical protein